MLGSTVAGCLALCYRMSKLQLLMKYMHPIDAIKPQANGTSFSIPYIVRHNFSKPIRPKH